MKFSQSLLVALLLSVSLLLPLYANAFSPDTVYAAEKIKKNHYISNGIITGGDALANPVNLASIRWAPNAGFERIVIDLSGEGSGWESKVPPYFQVGLEGQKNKITVSVRGISKRNLSQESLTKSIARSNTFSKAYLAPAYEGDLASIEFETNKVVEVEPFYLVNPPRIILDVRSKK